MNKTFLLGLLLLLISTSQVSGQYENAIKNQVIIRMQKDQVPEDFLQEIPKEFDLTIHNLLSEHADIWLMQFDEEQTNIQEVLQTLQKQVTVLYAQPNRTVELRTAPNDPFFGSQWHHTNIQSQQAWDITTGGNTADGKEIVVALIESADLINHNDLKDNHWKNTAEIPNNGIDDDGNGYIDDYNGWNVSTNDDDIGAGSHGTSCAGMMGATGNNNLGVTGINWDLKIMDIAGYNNPFTEANIIASYNYALNARLIWNQTDGAQGAFVVATSASWGVDGGNPANYPIWCSFYDDLGAVGILNVGATTNLDRDVDIYGDVPTGCASDYMIGVTASNYSDLIDFAGYGNQTIDLAAPGSAVYTTDENNSYASTSGTSFACPLTAGVIGLMYSIPCSNLEQLALIDPSGTATLVRESLLNGVDQSAHLQAKTITGGRLNAKNALDNIMNETCSLCMPPKTITIDNTQAYQADIMFNETDSVDVYQISLQIPGTGNWSHYSTSDTTYTFTGLTSCTHYEYYITPICNGALGKPSKTYSFRTAGCGNCIELSYCATEAVANSISRFTVHTPTSISGDYNFQATSNWGGNVNNGYVFGELVLVNDGSSSPNEGCNSLVNAAAINGNIAVVKRGSCNFTVKAMNAQNAGATALIVINNVPGLMEMGGSNSNVTIPSVMISQIDGNSLINSINNGEQPTALLGRQNEWIEEFQIDGNNFTSGDNNGYLFHDSTFILNQNQTIPFISTLGFDGQPLDEKLRIWIDYNQNGIFDSNELVFDGDNNGLGIIAGDFTIPSTALLGNTRMRVQLAYQGFGTSGLPDVCGNFSAGEVEDYCIEIKSGILCNMNVTSAVIEPTCNELQNGSININVSGGSPGYTYAWNNGMTGSNINNLNTNNYAVIITDASGCDTTIHFSLGYNTQLSLTETLTMPSCPNLNDGSISVVANGGSNFNYQWLNGPNNNAWSNLGEGFYQVTATDNNGCKITDVYKLSAPQVNSPIADFTSDHYYLMVEFNNHSINALSYQWDFDDGNSSTQINPTHTYIEEGNYNVCLTAFGQCDTTIYCKSINVEKDHTGVNKENNKTGLKIYPNPTSDLIYIENENKTATKAIIFAADGKQITKIEITTAKTMVATKEWSSGIYYMHFTTSQNELILTQKISVLE